MYQPLSLFQVVVFLAYLVLFLLLIQRWNFFRKSGISRRWLTTIFVVKCTAAILYGVYHLSNGGGDTFRLFEDGIFYSQHGQSHPLDYLKLVFGRNVGPVPSGLRPVIDGSHGYWADTANYTMVRFHALAAIISFGLYNVHALFMAFLSLIGLTGLYRFIRAYASDVLGPGAAVVLALPSVIFYGSGLHKEGLLIFSIGVLFWSMHRLMVKRQLAAVILALIFLFFLFLLKNFYLAALLPCLLAFFWVRYRPRFALPKYLVAMVACWAIAFNIKYVVPFDLADAVAQKQTEFLVLKSGDSHIEIQKVDSTIMSVVYAMPGALINVTTRPWPLDISKPLHVVYAVEQLFVLILVLVTAMFFSRRKSTHNPALLLITFSISVFIIIGIIVPNVGAISRYKAPALLCFVSGLVMLIDWERLQRKLGIANPSPL